MLDNRSESADRDIYFHKREYLERLRESEQGVEGALKIAHDLRKFEIDLYWKRSTNFWTFISVVLAGYGALLLGAAKDGIYKDHVYSYIIQLALFVLASLGAVLSFAWVRVNQGGKFWQQNWETQVDMMEDEAVGPVTKTIFAKSRKKFKLLSQISDEEIKEASALAENMIKSEKVRLDASVDYRKLNTLLEKIDRLDSNYWADFYRLDFRNASKKAGEVCAWSPCANGVVSVKGGLSKQGFPHSAPPGTINKPSDLDFFYDSLPDESVDIYSTSGINKIVSWVFFNVFLFLAYAGFVLMIYDMSSYYHDLYVSGGLGVGYISLGEFLSINNLSYVSLFAVLFIAVRGGFLINRAKTSTSIDNFYNISYRRADVTDDLTKEIRRKHINR